MQSINNTIELGFSNELDVIRQQFVDIKNENRRLKALLQKYDIPIDDNN